MMHDDVRSNSKAKPTFRLGAPNGRVHFDWQVWRGAAPLGKGRADFSGESVRQQKKQTLNLGSKLLLQSK